MSIQCAVCNEEVNGDAVVVNGNVLHEACAKHADSLMENARLAKEKQSVIEARDRSVGNFVKKWDNDFVQAADRARGERVSRKDPEAPISFQCPFCFQDLKNHKVNVVKGIKDARAHHSCLKSAVLTDPTGITAGFYNYYGLSISADDYVDVLHILGTVYNNIVDTIDFQRRGATVKETIEIQEVASTPIAEQDNLDIPHETTYDAASMFTIFKGLFHREKDERIMQVVSKQIENDAKGQDVFDSESEEILIKLKQMNPKAYLSQLIDAIPESKEKRRARETELKPTAPQCQNNPAPVESKLEENTGEEKSDDKFEKMFELFKSVKAERPEATDAEIWAEVAESISKKTDSKEAIIELAESSKKNKLKSIEKNDHRIEEIMAKLAKDKK